LAQRERPEPPCGSCFGESVCFSDRKKRLLYVITASINADHAMIAASWTVSLLGTWSHNIFEELISAEFVIKVTIGKEATMNSVIYLVGLIVVVLAILSFFGLH
jgi:hypothetical protein